MNLRLDGFGSLPRIGETIRLVPSQDDDLIIGVFNASPEAAAAVHLQPTQAEAFYSHLFHYGGEDSQQAALKTLLVPHTESYGYVAAEGCRVFLEQRRYSRPLVDPEYFYVVGPRERELPRSFVRRIGGSISGLFAPKLPRR